MQLLDDGWWMMFWRMGLAPMEANTPERLYDDLLPLLLGKPLEAAVLECKTFADDILCPLRTNEVYKDNN